MFFAAIPHVGASLAPSMAALSKALRLAILINNHATTISTVPLRLGQELGQPVAGLGAGRGVVVATRGLALGERPRGAAPPAYALRAQTESLN